MVNIVHDGWYITTYYVATLRIIEKTCIYGKIKSDIILTSLLNWFPKGLCIQYDLSTQGNFNNTIKYVFVWPSFRQRTIKYHVLVVQHLE